VRKGGGSTVSTSIDPWIGAELAGYRIEALVGRGGMGVVYRAWDARLKRNVAVKLVSPELSEDAIFRDRFLVESELAAALEHPNVVPIHTAGEVDGRLYLVMRLVEGSDLRRVLVEGPLTPRRSVAVLIQLAAALDAAHARGLVHRDVKPSNVLLDESDHVYLVDFGLTRERSVQAPAQELRSVGTPAYTAPEQVLGAGAAAQADQYALGCVLYECLTGEPPFQAERELAVLFAHLQEEPPRPSDSNPSLGTDIDAVVARALAKEPEDRYPSCVDLVDAAREALGLDVPASRDRRSFVLGATGLVVAGTAAGAFALRRARDGPPGPRTTPTSAPGFAALQRIDPRTNELVATLDLGADPTGVAVGEGGVWVIQLDANRITKLDPRGNSVLATGSSPGPNAITTGGGFAWVVNDDDTVSRLDSVTAAHLHDARVPDATELATFGAGAVWVASPRSGVVARVDPQRSEVSRTLDVAVQIGLLKQIAAGLGAVWLSTSDILADDFGVLRIDPATSRVASRIPVRRGAAGITVGAGSVWVTNPLGDSVSQIAPRTNRVVRTIPVGRGPIGVAAGPDAVWATNHREGTVSRIDPGRGRVAATIDVGPYPDHVAAGEGGVWVTVHPR
jgi:YVTN family beta-propeller protein